MSAAVVSTSVIGSAATRTHRRSGRSSAIPRTASPNIRELAKMSGASKRKTTRPGTEPAWGRTRCRAGRPAPRRGRARPGAPPHPPNTLRIDRMMASRMPGRTPSSATPSSATIERVNSVRAAAQPPGRRDVGEGQRGRDDDGPEGGLGDVLHCSVANTTTNVITAAPTTPVTCERDPACSATAVRDPLVLTGKPWNRPAAMFAAPMPIISWSPARARRGGRRTTRPSTSCPSATTAMATAPRKSLGVRPRDRGHGERGEPCGSTPMVTPFASRSSRLTVWPRGRRRRAPRGSWEAAAAAAGSRRGRRRRWRPRSG